MPGALEGLADLGALHGRELGAARGAAPAALQGRELAELVGARTSGCIAAASKSGAGGLLILGALNGLLVDTVTKGLGVEHAEDGLCFGISWYTGAGASEVSEQ